MCLRTFLFGKKLLEKVGVKLNMWLKFSTKIDKTVKILKKLPKKSKF